MNVNVDQASPIVTGRLEDGTYLTVSRSTPRFAVSAATREESVAKARRALDFYKEFAQERLENVRTLDLEPCEAA